MVDKVTGLCKDLESTTTGPARLAGRSNADSRRYLSFHMLIGAFLMALLQFFGNATFNESQGMLSHCHGMAVQHSILPSGVAYNNTSQRKRCTLPSHGKPKINMSPDININNTSPNSGFRRLGRSFVITLEHRTDRMTNFTRGMADVGVTNFTVIPGVPHKCPQLGVTLAHVAALQLCWGSNWVDSCLIMEDDFALRLPRSEAAELIDRFYVDVQEWDVLMLGCNLLRHATLSAKNQTLPPYVARVMSGYSSSGYVIRRAYAPNVTYTLLGGLSRLKEKCSYGDALDVTWAGLQAKDGWYTMPNAARKGSILGYQAASFSDIERSHTDYGVR
jgi:hypothetical protein